MATKGWRGELMIGMTLSLEEIRKFPSRFKKFFTDPNNPTDEEVRDYFQFWQQDSSSRSYGLQMLADANLKITQLKE